jgi:hypothetical protein
MHESVTELRVQQTALASDHELVAVLEEVADDRGEVVIGRHWPALTLVAPLNRDDREDSGLHEVPLQQKLPITLHPAGFWNRFLKSLVILPTTGVNLD